MLQENGTTWWTILWMMHLLTQKDVVDLSLVRMEKHKLILSVSEVKDIKAIIKLLKGFERAGDKLLSKDNVTISVIIPIFETLSDHLKTQTPNNTLIAHMKAKMLVKLNNIYSPEQMKLLKLCSLLDVRYKCEKYLKKDSDTLEADIKQILEAQGELEPQPESECEVPNTEGNEHWKLSMFNSDSSNDTTMFEYKDDSIDESQVPELSGLHIEVEFYKKVRMTKEAKASVNIWEWWNQNRTSYPCLYISC